jgi:Probable transposase
MPGRGVIRWGEARSGRGAAPRDHRGQRPPGLGPGCPRSPRWRWCSRFGACAAPTSGSTTTGSTRSGSAARAARSGVRGSRQGQPAILPVHPQRIKHPWRRQALSLPRLGMCGSGWSRELPCDASSVTIIREPEGHCYAGVVVEVAPAPLPPVEREAGVDVGIARLASVATSGGARLGIPNRKHLARKLRTLRRREREKARRAKGGTNRAETRRKVAVQHGKVTRARRDYHHKQALGLVRENHAVHVEDLPHRGHGHTSPIGAGDPRRRVGRVCSAAARQGRTVRPDCAHRGWVAALLQDVLALWACHGRHAAQDPRMGLSRLRGRARSGPQRCDQHPRRRACGEAKRLWSRCQSFPRGGSR